MAVGSQAPPRPRIALTLGDPAGIGPELAVKLLADPQNRAKADIFVLADFSEIKAAEAQAGVTVPVADVAGVDGVQILDDGSAPTEPIPIGQVSIAAGQRSMYQLRRAVALANNDDVDAIVFTPLNKTSCHHAGMHEEDELRWFAKGLHHDGFTSEINIIKGLWTGRVTSHCGIKDVAARITMPAVCNAIELLHTMLSEHGIHDPRIGVCALNPHAGENGLFGREEIDAIRPAVEKARSRGVNVTGPWPSDTIFLKRAQFDGVVSMFHDQGQIAVKLIGFDGGVTLQGGLPVVVATPAHGTAFDIVGRGIASSKSSQNALDVAISIASRRRDKAHAKTDGVN